MAGPGGIHGDTGKGPYRQQVPVWKAATAVEIRDMCYREADGYDYPVSNYAWNTDLATTLAALVPLLRGISMAKRIVAQGSDGGRADGNLLVSGEFWLPVAALGTAAKPGDLYTLAKQSGNAIENQKYVKTSTAAQACFKVTEDAAVGAVYVKAEMMIREFSVGPLS